MLFRFVIFHAKSLSVRSWIGDFFIYSIFFKVIGLQNESIAMRQYKQALINQGIEQGAFDVALRVKKLYGLDAALSICDFSREELLSENKKSEVEHLKKIHPTVHVEVFPKMNHGQLLVDHPEEVAKRIEEMVYS